MEMIRRILARFVRAGIVVPVIVLAVSLVELAISSTPNAFWRCWVVV